MASKKPTETVLIPATPTELIRALLAQLGHDAENVASIEILATGRVRILGTDRSARSARVEWPAVEAPE